MAFPISCGLSERITFKVSNCAQPVQAAGMSDPGVTAPVSVARPAESQQ